MKRKQSAALMSMSAATQGSVPAEAADGAADPFSGEIRLDDNPATTEVTDVGQHLPALHARQDAKALQQGYRLPDAERQVLADLKKQCGAMGVRIRKTDLLVAGLHLLAALPKGKLLAVIGPHETKRKKPLARS